MSDERLAIVTGGARGLGLAMVNEIATLHGGSLTLANTDNGVRATLTIH